MNEKIILSRALTTPRDGCGPLLQGSGENAFSLRQQVFEYVRAHGQAARADITTALGISPGSATTLTADLITSGFLREFEGRARETGRGRPKVGLEVVPNAAYVIGIKLAFNRHTAVLADFAGKVIADASFPSGDTRRPMAQLLQETQNLVDRLLKESGISPSDIKAMGIGMPGIIDHSTGTVAWSSLLEVRNEDLTAAFSERFGMPLLLDNDANMLTLAELWFGEGRAMSDFAVVTVESGVGMGLVLRNQLYRGAHGMGLELGHTKVQLDGALCQCGQRGCLEAYVADYALIREAATALGHSFDTSKNPEDVLATLFERAKSGHTAAETIFRRAGKYLSLGLSNVVQLFDPELIILSGERMQNDYFYAEEVLDTMEKLTLNEGRQSCRVAVNAWDDLVWARGASALALSSVTATLIDEMRAA
ncbi:ROK family transcriptional regulator [Roseobacter weihaiensis]|uniref:ROK family transcriptional regulator n=1 Tax=Roseobacter weihaiensis TaxID=2763262 RepID=UPI001D09F559|nr:ROK family protein [Roseobacter sp. H9]